MKKSIYTDHAPTLEQVGRIQQGLANRAEAAEALGISVATFNSRLCRAKLTKGLKGTRPAPTEAQIEQRFQPMDPDKASLYDSAVAEALRSPSLKATKLKAKYPNLSYQMLVKRVREAKEARASEYNPPK